MKELSRSVLTGILDSQDIVPTSSGATKRYDNVYDALQPYLKDKVERRVYKNEAHSWLITHFQADDLPIYKCARSGNWVEDRRAR